MKVEKKNYFNLIDLNFNTKKKKKYFITLFKILDKHKVKDILASENILFVTSKIFVGRNSFILLILLSIPCQETKTTKLLNILINNSI